jgi:hypothetical protein
MKPYTKYALQYLVFLNVEGKKSEKDRNIMPFMLPLYKEGVTITESWNLAESSVF